MLRIQRLLSIFSALTALALLAGCGSNTTANQTGLSTSTPEPSSSSATLSHEPSSGVYSRMILCSKNHYHYRLLEAFQKSKINYNQV